MGGSLIQKAGKTLMRLAKALKRATNSYMGMEFFSGEGLDLIFPLGGGAIFQPRGGLGGGPKQRNFS